MTPRGGKRKSIRRAAQRPPLFLIPAVALWAQRTRYWGLTSVQQANQQTSELQSQISCYLGIAQLNLLHWWTPCAQLFSNSSGRAPFDKRAILLPDMVWNVAQAASAEQTSKLLFNTRMCIEKQSSSFCGIRTLDTKSCWVSVNVLYYVLRGIAGHISFKISKATEYT